MGNMNHGGSMSTTAIKTTFFSPEATAQMFGTSKKTVYREIERGNLRAHRAGHQFRISHTEINRYLAERMVR